MKFQDSLRSGGIIRGPIQIYPRNDSEVPFTVQGLVTNVGSDLMIQVKDSSGNIKFSVDYDGNIVGNISGFTPGNYVLKAGDTMTGDLIGKSFIPTRSGTISRDANGYVSSISFTGGRTVTYTRNAEGYIITATDGTRTYSFTRDSNNKVTSWTIV